MDTIHERSSNGVGIDDGRSVLVYVQTSAKLPRRAASKKACTAASLLLYFL